MCVFKLSKGIGFRLPHNRVIDICLDFFLLVKHGRKRIFYHKCQELSSFCSFLLEASSISTLGRAHLIEINGSGRRGRSPRGGGDRVITLARLVSKVVWSRRVQSVMMMDREGPAGLRPHHWSLPSSRGCHQAF